MPTSCILQSMIITLEDLSEKLLNVWFNGVFILTVVFVNHLAKLDRIMESIVDRLLTNRFFTQLVNSLLSQIISFFVLFFGFQKDEYRYTLTFFQFLVTETLFSFQFISSSLITGWIQIIIIIFYIEWLDCIIFFNVFFEFK